MNMNIYFEPRLRSDKPIVQCPHCPNLIREKDTTCPHCGESVLPLNYKDKNDEN